jgi:hypothetical protein
MATPSISIKKVLAARIKIAEVCNLHRGALVTGEAFNHLVSSVHQEILTTDLRAVANSMRSVAGRHLTDDVIDELSWRLAGNLHRLAKGMTVAPWTSQAEKEWATMQVSQVIRKFRRYKAKTEEQAALAGADGKVSKAGILLKFRILTGLAAGRSSEKFWSDTMCEMLKSEFGYDKWNRARRSRNVGTRPSWPFLAYGEFFRLRLQVLVDPELCQFGEVGFQEVRGTAATKKWNREIMRMRLRDGFVCPAGYSEDFSCHLCPIGLGKCKAACHALDYQTSDCEVCHKTDRFFDVDISETHCVDCAVSQY